MAITKRARNSILRVNTKHFIMAGEIEKTAEKMKLIATCGNIELYSINKIRKNGNIN